MTAIDTDLTPEARTRLHESIALALASLTAEDHYEMEVLCGLDPAERLISLRDIGHHEVCAIYWGSAEIGLISWDWVLTGEMPDPWPPTWYDEMLRQEPESPS